MVVMVSVSQFRNALAADVFLTGCYRPMDEVAAEEARSRAEAVTPEQSWLVSED